MFAKLFAFFLLVAFASAYTLGRTTNRGEILEGSMDTSMYGTMNPMAAGMNIPVMSSAAMDSSAMMTHGKRCVPGASYFDGCNMCLCQQGSVACTLQHCEAFNPRTGMFEPAKRLPAPASFWVY